MVSVTGSVIVTAVLPFASMPSPQMSQFASLAHYRSEQKDIVRLRELLTTIITRDEALLHDWTMSLTEFPEVTGSEVEALGSSGGIKTASMT
jgi:hypothetical protein